MLSPKFKTFSHKSSNTTPVVHNEPMHGNWLVDGKGQSLAMSDGLVRTNVSKLSCKSFPQDGTLFKNAVCTFPEFFVTLIMIFFLYKCLNILLSGDEILHIFLQ